jgi:hypothetical protein
MPAAVEMAKSHVFLRDGQVAEPVHFLPIWSSVGRIDLKVV